MTPPRQTFSRRLQLAAVAVLLASAQSSLAQIDYFWDAITGDFNDSANWSPNGVPGMFDYGIINNGGTATFASSPGNQLVDQMRVGYDTASSGTLIVTGGQLSPDRLLIGEYGNGTTTVSGGQLSVGGGSIFIGGTEGSGAQTGVGELNVSGGAGTMVSSGDDFQFGASGTGTFNMSGGWATGIYTVVGKFGTGVWNHSGGVYDQGGGDIEIGDGGRPDQLGTPGPRTGTINLSGGVIQVADHVGIGNRRGTGTVNVSGGALVATGGAGSTIYVGRGMDTSPGDGGVTELRVTGSDGVVVANGALSMNTSMASSSSTLIAEITGASHTTIKVAGDALISNGSLKVELNGYSPVSGDSWTLLEAGADISAELTLVDSIVSAGGYPALTHASPAALGSLIGTFASIDFSLASLTAGLSWDVSYDNDAVVLSILGSSPLPGDYNNDGMVDNADYTVWKGAYGGTVLQNETSTPGSVDAADYTVWRDNFGAGVPASFMSAVPEPASSLLAALSLAGTMGARSRRDG
jgi:hypothetical protein